MGHRGTPQKHEICQCLCKVKWKGTAPEGTPQPQCLPSTFYFTQKMANFMFFIVHPMTLSPTPSHNQI